MYLSVRIIIFLLQIVSSSAQTFTVLEVKEGQAVIAPSDDLPLEVNHTYSVHPKGEAAKVKLPTATSGGDRQKVLGLSGEISDLFNNKTDTTSTYNLSARYGWNLVDYTFGPQFGVSYVKKTATEVVSYNVGGFLDYNFIPNRAGHDFVWGMNIHLGFADTDTYTFLTASNSTNQSLNTYLGPFAKWFLGHSSTCIRFDVQYAFSTLMNVDATTSSQTSGLYSTIGIEAYY